MRGNKELNAAMLNDAEQALAHAVQWQVQNKVPNISIEDTEKAQAEFIKHTSSPTLRGILVITINDTFDMNKGPGVAADIIAVGTSELMDRSVDLLHERIDGLANSTCEHCGGDHGEAGMDEDALDRFLLDIAKQSNDGRTHGLADALLMSVLLGPLARRR